MFASIGRSSAMLWRRSDLGSGVLWHEQPGQRRVRARRPAFPLHGPVAVSLLGMIVKQDHRSQKRQVYPVFDRRPKDRKDHPSANLDQIGTRRPTHHRAFRLIVESASSHGRTSGAGSA